VLTLGLVLIVSNVIVRVAAMPRLYSWARRVTPLPFYTAFLTLALTQAIIIQPGWWIFKRMDVYKAVQSQMFLPMTCLQIISIFEAFWWLVTCLPNFRKVGCWLMFLLVLASLAFTRPTLGSVAEMEQTCGFALAIFVGCTIMVHRVIGTDCKPALWHAGCLGAVSFFHGIVWGLQGSRTLMTLSYVLQIGASIMWLWMVRAPPTWKEPEAKPYNEEGVNRAWEEFRQGD
jgi:hypothetical protein